MQNEYELKLTEELGLLVENIIIEDLGNSGYKLTDKLFDKVIDQMSEGDLFNTLQETIYRNYYKKLNLNKDNTFSELDNEFRERIEGYFANISRYLNRDAEEGWLIESMSMDTGALIAQKRDYEKKLIFPGNYLHKSLDFPFKENQEVKASWFKAKRFNGDNTYFYLHGQSIPDDYSGQVNQVRFYLNLNANEDFKKNFPIPDEAGRLSVSDVENTLFYELLAEFNIRKIPFQLKVLTIRRNYSVSDTCVIYLENKYFFMSLELILRITNPKKYHPLFADHVPMFTKQVAKGIGFAESPTNSLNSFGRERSLFVAKEIVSHFKKKDCLPTADELLETIKIKFPVSFYLNSNSYYPYNFDYKIDLSKSLVNPNSQSLLMKTAMQIGYIICKEVLFDSDQRCNWLGSVNRKSFKTLDLSVLRGIGGVSLFLGQLFEQTREPVYIPVIAGTLKTINDNLRKQIEARHWSFYNGVIGSIYTLLKVSSQLGNSYLASELNTNIKESFTAYFQAESTEPSILEGIAGEVMGLIKIYNLLSDDVLKDQVQEVIEKKAIWLQKTDPNNFLEDSFLKFSGYAQGLSGIGLALIEAGIFLNKDNLKVKGIDLINFEIDKLVRNTSNQGWAKTNMSNVGVCLVLNRLISLKLSSDKTLAKLFKIVNNLDVNKLIVNGVLDSGKTEFMVLQLLTVEQGLGTLELSMEMKRNFSEGLIHVYDKIYRQIIAENLAREIADETYSLLNFDRNVGFQVNLYQGLAGIGYGLLRMYKPDEVEPLLILRP